MHVAVRVDAFLANHLVLSTFHITVSSTSQIQFNNRIDIEDMD